MSNLSLRARSLIFAIISLLLFVPAMLFTLERAFVSSLEQAKYNELKLMSLAMITAFELEDDNAFMPQQLFEEQLNLPGSGYMGFVLWQGDVVWRSMSALDYADPTDTIVPDVGSEQFDTYPLPTESDIVRQEDPFRYLYSAEYENGGVFEPVTFVVFNEQFEFQQEKQMFMITLWRWLLLLSAVLLVLIYFISHRLLAPVTEIVENIEAAGKGEIERLTGQYPPELEPLKLSINQLLSAEAQQRMRYKNSLGDLAHSLNTPLAVLTGDSAMPASAAEPLEQINSIIQRQLKRAVGSSTARVTPQALLPLLTKLVNAMQKVHASQQLSISVNVDAALRVKADETDLLEIFGNLLDNACKSAQHQVSVSAQHQQRSVIVHIDDDGSGIDVAHASEILSRGKRLDTYEEGQGIGLSVVMDLVDSYEGQLRIGKSPHNGARFSIRLPSA